MKKIRLTESELTNIIKRVINEQDSNYIQNELYSLGIKNLYNYIDKSIEDSKKELSQMGGKFPQGNPPTEEDWKQLKIRLLHIK